MKVNVSLEVEVESVAAAVQSILYAIDCEGGDDIEVLEVSASPAYSADSSTETVVNNHTTITNCTCHEDQDVHLEGEQVKSGARALPATLS